MRTLHTADAVLTADGAPADSVAVDSGVIVAIGPYATVTAAHPGARVRRWSGLLAPGLWRTRAAGLLEAAYHPDPREAAELGAEPLTGAALAALEMDETRWGASARRGLQRMLAQGTTAVTGPFSRPSVRTAVARSGLRVRVRETERPGDGPEILLDGELVLGGPADFAVFAAKAGGGLPTRASLPSGTARCVATVLGGRLVYRSA
ncbi:imidazolonepropionase-like domain-containing protein [Streptomyces jumonjinensis]|uniref:imidazolonepropionase-like domain-containing protein n=1 Tax=Streptomyces jumonjinensis TaxID=1945 RepID=UPI0037A76E32